MEVEGDFNIEQVIVFLKSTFCFNTNLSKNIIWRLFYIIISYVDKVVIIYIDNTTSFMDSFSKKYSSITEFHIFLESIFVCVFISPLASLTSLDWILYNFEYLLFLCIGICNKDTSPFFELIDGEVNLGIYQFLNADILPFIKG